ncbi:hypothetical protein D3C78_1035990 [compost metagenome]
MRAQIFDAGAARQALPLQQFEDDGKRLLRTLQFGADGRTAGHALFALCLQVAGVHLRFGEAPGQLFVTLVETLCLFQSVQTRAPLAELSLQRSQLLCRWVAAELLL